MSMHIEFVNHASIIIEAGSLRILTDPWLIGSAFDDGWDLLVDTPHPIDAMDFTHIWISHEHPDHFSPPTLRAVPEGRRARTPLLFQRTRDRKVEEYCRHLGFPVMVLDHFTRTPIDDGVTIAVGPSRGFDTWLMVEAGGQRVLNVNDCYVEDPERLKEIAEFCGELDLLALQFGYANWVCNPDSTEVARDIADYYLSIVKREVRTLKPTAALPFASYSYYSAEDNDWLNEEQATASQAEQAIRNAGAAPVVMYPGDRWQVGDDSWDNAPALARWEQAYAALPDKPRHKVRAVAMSDVEEAFADCQKRVAERNDWQAIVDLKNSGGLPAAAVWLEDLGVGLEFCLVEGLAPTSSVTRDCADIVLSAASFAYTLYHDWGRGTVGINGRFWTPQPSGLWHFWAQTQIPFANNIGKRFPDDLDADAVTNPRAFVINEVVPRLLSRAGGSPGVES